jgi:hypothetical protein
MGSLVIGLILLMREFLHVAWAHVGTKLRSGGRFGGGEAPAAPTGQKFDIRVHLPFLGGMTIGMLAISCPGGIIGLIAGKVLGLSNTLGDKAISSGTGQAAADITRHTATQLNAAGTIVTLLLIAGVVILRKSLAKQARHQLFAGIWCGITLGLCSGAAGLTGHILIPAANRLGAALSGAV